MRRIALLGLEAAAIMACWGASLSPAARAADEPCRNFTSEATIDGERQTIVGRACRQADGTWRVVPATTGRARAAPAPMATPPFPPPYAYPYPPYAWPGNYPYYPYYYSDWPFWAPPIGIGF